MPCILVENKADLLGENEIDNTQELEVFAEEMDSMEALEHQLKLDLILMKLLNF